MRIPSSVFAAARYTLGLTLVAGSVLLMSAPKKTQFTVHDKAYYADSNTVSFVRPGLTITIVSASVATDGTISVRYKLADPKGLALDQAGVQTPGTVSTSFIAAYIPSGQTQYVAYTTRVQTSPITKVSATQAGADSGGTTAQVADGEYTYTFKQKAVPTSGTYDATATHAIGIYGSRNLTEFDLGTYYDDAVYTFVPNGAKVTVTRDVIKTSSCNKCHTQLAFHGGSRKSMELCVLCHTPQTVDPDTGNTLDMPVMTHKIHAGEELPSVQAGTKYQIIGYNQAVSDWSTVAFPAVSSKNCTFCHEQTTGAAQQTAYLKPNRTACGSCHDNVNFATGKNHADLAQVSDNQCASCHVPQGEVEFDVSIKGAHLLDRNSTQVPGLNFTLVKVDNGSAGKNPTVTFTIKDNNGNGILASSLKTSPNRVYLVMAGPTTDYGYTSFGSDVTTPGYVSENATTASCDSSGTCSYTFTHAIPAAATGTYTIGIEGRIAVAFNAGTTKARTANYGAVNKTISFSVDGSTVAARRTVVDIAKCNGCHSFLSLHGENRNQIEQCVLCHNPSETDSSVRSASTAVEKAKPYQSVNFALMIHKIHTGENGNGYTVVGYGGSVNDFGEVRYPAMTKTGGVGATQSCTMCHVNGSEAVLPVGKLNVKDPQGLLTTVPATTSACMACHQTKSALAHAQSNTDGTYGESCDVCHGTGADFNTIKVHAQ
jgi:OmcA/MtrC family decaheme c-type cytochrome